MPPVTQKAIADRLGVHSTTVSMALRGVTSIPAQTRSWIVKTAKEMGYQPNAMARNLRYQKSQTIGVLASPRLGEMMLRRIMMASQVAQDRGYEVLLFSPRFDDQNYEKAINSLASHRVRGMIVASGGWADIPNAMEAWRQQNWPAVYLMPMQPFSMENLVDTDRAQGYRDAVAHLSGLGHRNIALVAQTETGWVDVRGTTRLDGYRAGLKDAGIEQELILETVLKSEPALADLARHIAQMDDRPTAVLAYSDRDALWLIRHLLKIGLRVPEDISVVGFDGGAAAESSILPLTTISQPVDDIARSAVDKVLEIADGQTPQSFSPILCKPELIVRESTGAAPSTISRFSA